MKHSLGLVIGALLSLSLYISTDSSVRAIGEASTALATKPLCSTQFHEQEIPDDGSWLQVCLLDPAAPDGTTVTKANVKYRIEHPNTDQLEVLLTREDGIIRQHLWERGSLVKGPDLGKATGLDIFNGTPAQGGWYFWVRDAVPGQSGWLRDASISIYYTPVGPLPIQISGTPGRPTSLRIPPGVEKSITPDRDEKKSEGEVQSLLLEPDGWRILTLETFESNFPGAGWALVDNNPNDGKEYLWDDDDFRSNDGYWAAWPANGGADGLDPAFSTYPPNAQSWMIYGPFDLGDATGATAAEAIFWLWRQIEENYDYIFFGASGDGATFNGLMWDGTAEWDGVQIDLNNYLGDSTVWAGWYFYSDNVVQYEGPWVDNIMIRRYTPGQVTAQGILEYPDRNDSRSGGVSLTFIFTTRTLRG